MQPGAHAGNPVAGPDPAVLIEEANQRRKLPAAEMVSTLVLLNAQGKQRVRKILSYARLEADGITEKRLVRFLEPADVKGTGLLTFDYDKKTDDLWLYLPALRKTRRIVASEKAKSFMGSEFTYSDTTPPPTEDFTYQLLGEETVDGVSCWIIDSFPRNEKIADENGFSRKTLFLGKEDYVLRKAVYYDLGKKLHKELLATQVKLIEPNGKKYRAMLMTMQNKQNGRSSELRIEKLELKPAMSEDFFTTRFLERP
ncbi:MAG: hypothetical protein A2284_11470 [Deltaproteobacteria bacterium RIFOXYA12_FULL_61_11]|nr:MAG: hypothetical protein A2284_11470 [Deltaproteobacteria bacterium RIFOXYA12_FULL_61_11]